MGAEPLKKWGINQQNWWFIWKNWGINQQNV